MEARVKLNGMEVALARWTAAKKNEWSRSQGHTSRNTGPRDDVTIMREGMLGEIAACKWLDTYYMPSLSPNRGGVDFRTSGGLGVDAKATQYRGGNSFLHVKPYKVYENKNPDVDLYMLVGRETENDHVLVGWYPAKPLHESPDAYTKRPWGEDLLVVENHELLDPADLHDLSSDQLDDICERLMG
jgi:hypothetical protein